MPTVINRAVLTGIILVLQTGLRWTIASRDGLRQRHQLLALLALLAGRRRLGAIARGLLARLCAPGETDWSSAILDSPRLRAVGSGSKTGPNPQTAPDPVQSTTSAPKGRASLAVILTGANRN